MIEVWKPEQPRTNGQCCQCCDKPLAEKSLIIELIVTPDAPHIEEDVVRVSFCGFCAGDLDLAFQNIKNPSVDSTRVIRRDGRREVTIGSPSEDIEHVF